MGARKGPYFFIPLRLITTFTLPESLGFILGCAMGSVSVWEFVRQKPDAGVATFLIKRKWPKIDQGGPWTPLRRQAVQGGSGLARHWFHGRFQASALPLVKLWAVLRSAGLPEGPGSLARHWFRGRFQAALWAPGRADFLYPNQGGRVSPDSAANSGRAGLTPPRTGVAP